MSHRSRAGSLGEAVKNPTSLVLVQGAVKIELVLENPLADDELVLENPLADDDVGANRTRDKISCVVGDQGNKLFFHGATLVRIDEGGTDGGGYRQQGWRRGCR
jgi:hypothetical protein